MYTLILLRFSIQVTVILTSGFHCGNGLLIPVATSRAHSCAEVRSIAQFLSHLLGLLHFFFPTFGRQLCLIEALLINFYVLTLLLMRVERKAVALEIFMSDPKLVDRLSSLFQRQLLRVAMHLFGARKDWSNILLFDFVLFFAQNRSIINFCC